jgi:hypothetical protein
MENSAVSVVGRPLTQLASPSTPPDLTLCFDVSDDDDDDDTTGSGKEQENEKPVKTKKSGKAGKKKKDNDVTDDESDADECLSLQRGSTMGFELPLAGWEETLGRVSDVVGTWHDMIEAEEMPGKKKKGGYKKEMKKLRLYLDFGTVNVMNAVCVKELTQNDAK